MVASINCGHTRLLLVTKKYSAKERDSINSIGIKPIEQFNYIVKGNKLFIKQNKSEDSTFRSGTEILEINNESAANIVNKLEALIPSDGFNKTFKEAVLNRSFSGWYKALYTDQDSMNIKIGIADQYRTTVLRPKKIKKVLIKTKVLSEEEKEQKKKDEKQARKLRYKGFDEYKQPNLEFNFLNADSSTAYIKIKSFSFPHADFERFYKESFSAIKEAGSNNLIIDLRNNGGGSLKACRELFSYLVDKDFTFLKTATAKGRFVNAGSNFTKAVTAPFIAFANLLLIKKDKEGNFYANLTGTKPMHPKKDNFKGKIYVILNGYSFSASTLFSANLAGTGRAIFVGSESGGGFNQCTAGRIPIIDLPNSKLKLRFGLYKIAPNASSETIGRGVFPDHMVIRELKDEIYNKDPEMEYILSTIKKAK
ncbi:hypothetical protein EON78_04980 [bacterium]|nr:MAG: hypothetical protein EON78_04980 [bacterium]